VSGRLIGYFENWAQYRPAGGKFLPAQIDPAHFTHINFAFGIFGFITRSVDPQNPRLTGDFTVQPVEWNDQTLLYPALQQLKQGNPALKTLLSIGGWSFNDPQDVNQIGTLTSGLFSQMASSSAGRQQFIESAIAYARNYGFDGIDIDWEYPGYAGRGGAPADLANFLALVTEFRAMAGPGFLLSMAAPAVVPTGVPAEYHQDPASYYAWLAVCAQQLDWLNVMCYDYHGAFDDAAAVGTGVNAPLLRDSSPNGTFSIQATLAGYLGAGIPSDKLNLGMPTYGRTYTVSNPSQLGSDSAPGKPFSGPGPAGAATGTPGILAYYEIAGNTSLVQNWDNATLTPYAYNAQTGLWISYDNPESLGYKISYALGHNLGGAMIWAIDNDAFASGSPLISSVKGILDNPASAPVIPDAVRDWAAQRADVARRWAEAQKASRALEWTPLDPSEPPKPVDMRTTVFGAGDAVRRICEGYADVLRRRGEAWLGVPRVGITGPTVQASFAPVIADWRSDVIFTEHNVDLSTEVQGDSQDVILRLTEGLSDATLRLGEAGVPADFSGLLAQYQGQNGLRLAEAYADGFRRISEGWKDALLRVQELGFRGPGFNKLAVDSVTWLFGQFIQLTCGQPNIARQSLAAD
jgi:chitinase